MLEFWEGVYFTQDIAMTSLKKTQQSKAHVEKFIGHTSHYPSNNSLHQHQAK